MNGNDDTRANPTPDSNPTEVLGAQPETHPTQVLGSQPETQPQADPSTAAGSYGPAASYGPPAGTYGPPAAGYGAAGAGYGSYGPSGSYNPPGGYGPSGSPYPPAGAPQSPWSGRRLTRSRSDRMVGGVLGGLAQYWNTDPVLLRILTVVLTLFSGGALIIAYVIALIVIPEEAPMGSSPFPATDADQVGYASGGTPPYAGYSPMPPAPRDRSYLGWLVVSAAVLAAGVLALIGALTPVSVRMWGVAGGVVLAILGVGLLIGARYGRARWLVIPAIPLAFMSFATVAAGQWAEDNPNWDRWSDPANGIVVGDQTWTVQPDDVGGAPLVYRLTAGEAELDLTELTALGGAEPGRPAQRVEIEAGVALGQLQVIMPADMALDLDATVDAGEIRVPGREPVDGTDLSVETYIQASTGENPAYIVTLDAAVGAGNLEVLREAA